MTTVVGKLNQYQNNESSSEEDEPDQVTPRGWNDDTQAR